MAVDETPTKSIYTTASSSPIDCNDWIQRVKTITSRKAPGFQVLLWKTGDGEKCMVSQTDLSRYDPTVVLATGVAPVILHVSADGFNAVQVLFRDVLKGKLKDEEDVTSILSVMTSYKVCPGLKSAPEVNSLSKRTWGFPPWRRVDSNTCFLLHLPGNKKTISWL